VDHRSLWFSRVPLPPVDAHAHRVLAAFRGSVRDAIAARDLWLPERGAQDNFHWAIHRTEPAPVLTAARRWLGLMRRLDAPLGHVDHPPGGVERAAVVHNDVSTAAH